MFSSIFELFGVSLMFNKLLLLVWRVSSSLVRPILMIHVKKLLVWRVCCKTMSLSLHINHSRSDINLSSSSMSSYFDFVSFVFLCPTCCSKPEEYSEEYKSLFVFIYVTCALFFICSYDTDVKEAYFRA